MVNVGTGQDPAGKENSDMAMVNDLRMTSLVDDAELPWAPVTDGIELRVLRVGLHDNTYQMMTRIQPGVQLPRHRHFGEVHLYTVSGTWGYREYGWLARPGTYV